MNPFVKGLVEGAKNAFSLKHAFPFDINRGICGYFRTQWEGSTTIGLEEAKDAKSADSRFEGRRFFVPSRALGMVICRNAEKQSDERQEQGGPSEYSWQTSSTNNRSCHHLVTLAE